MREPSINERFADVLPHAREKEKKPDPIDFEAQIRGQHHCPSCGADAAHSIVSNYHVCSECDFYYGMRAREYFEQDPVGSHIGADL